MFLKGVEEWGRNYDIVLDVIPPCVSAIGSVTKYFTAIIFSSKVQKLLDYMRSNCTELSKLQQKVIMKQYAANGRKVLLCYIGAIFTVLAMYAVTYFEPIIFDMIKESNESKEIKLLFPCKTFVDEQKYYLPITMWQYTTAFILVFQLVAADALFLMFVQHTCTLFSVAGDYIKYLHISDDDLAARTNEIYYQEQYIKNLTTQKQNEKMYHKFRYAILLHQKTVMYCDTLESIYTVSLAILLLFNVLLISSTGFQFINNTNNIEGILRYGGFVLGQLFHLFFICFPGQKLLDHSEYFYKEICTGFWYMYPKEVHGLYKLMILRSSTFSRLTAGKVATLGMETYLSVLQTAVSYFTMLLSIQ